MSGNRESLLSRLGYLLGRKQAEHSLRDSIAELVQEAAEAQHPGEQPELDRHERLLIANVLRLRETTADDVMVPRPDIVAMRADVTLAQAIELIRNDGHSRLPVYREQLDDVIGMVHIKDVFAYVGRPEAFSLEAILRKPLLVAPQIPVLDLLLQMRMQRMHLALVVDEYGGIDGLVTIEDLVETITGDIADEHDDVEAPMITERQDGALDLNARLSIEDFEHTPGPSLDRRRARRRHRNRRRAGVHSRRPGAHPRRSHQPPVRHGVPRAGLRPAPDPPAARPPAGGGGGGLGEARALPSTREGPAALRSHLIQGAWGSRGLRGGCNGTVAPCFPKPLKWRFQGASPLGGVEGRSPRLACLTPAPRGPRWRCGLAGLWRRCRPGRVRSVGRSR